MNFMMHISCHNIFSYIYHERVRWGNKNKYDALNKLALMQYAVSQDGKCENNKH